MTGRILTYTEWKALEDAERPIYASEQGIHAVTEVSYREDSADIAGMWDQAYSVVESLIGFDDDLADEAAAVAEVARRIAVAQYYLIIGSLPSAAVPS